MGTFSIPAGGPADAQGPRNPILEELDRAAADAHAKLSPGAQEALRRSGAPIPGAGPTAPPIASVRLPGPIGGTPPPMDRAPLSSQEMSAPGVPATAAPPVASAPAPAALSPLEAAQQRERDVNQRGTGISRIHNPLLRGLATAGDIVAGTFSPRAEQLIPGTVGRHALDLGRARQQVQEEEANLNQPVERSLKANQAADYGSQVGLRGSQSHLADIQAQTLEEEGKRPPKWNFITVGDGLYDADNRQWVKEPSDKTDKNLFEVDEEAGKALHLVPNTDGRYMVPASVLAPKATPEGEKPLPNVDQMNQALTSRYRVLHPRVALPSQYTIPPNATQKDYDRIDKALEAEEKAGGTKAQQDEANQLHRDTLASNQANRDTKNELASKQATLKSYTPALDTAERFNVMTKNYEDAVKNNDQQAMLSLLANHLGMTMGLQKGARLTRDIITEAEKSRPWLQGMAAKFDKDGYLSGVTLTPRQMRQMVDLGRSRFSEDVGKARSESEFLGGGEGPARTPNKSTINHYTALAEGDPKKAKELAAADGWTVK